MSFQAMALAVKIKTDSPTDKLVLMMLANYASEDLQSYPSYATLARECCMSDRAVIVAMGRLRKQGLVTWIKRKKYSDDESRELTSNLYTLHLSGKPTTHKKKKAENAMPTGGSDKKSSESPVNTSTAYPAPPPVNNLHNPYAESAQNTITDTKEVRKEDLQSKNSEFEKISELPLHRQIMTVLLSDELSEADPKTIQTAKFKALEYIASTPEGKLAAGCMYVLEGIRIQREKQEDRQAITDMEAWQQKRLTRKA